MSLWQDRISGGTEPISTGCSCLRGSLPSHVSPSGWYLGLQRRDRTKSEHPLPQREKTLSERALCAFTFNYESVSSKEELQGILQDCPLEPNVFCHGEARVTKERGLK